MATLKVGDWVRTTVELDLDGVGVTVPAGTVGRIREFQDGIWVYCPSIAGQLPATDDCVVVHDAAELEEIDLRKILVRCRIGNPRGHRTESITTLATWAADNADLFDIDDVVARLLAFEAVEGGGGAAPRYVVQPLPWVLLSEEELNDAVSALREKATRDEARATEPTGLAQAFRCQASRERRLAARLEEAGSCSQDIDFIGPRRK